MQTLEQSRCKVHLPLTLAVGDANLNVGRLGTAGTTVAEEVSSLETTRIGLEWRVRCGKNGHVRTQREG